MRATREDDGGLTHNRKACVWTMGNGACTTRGENGRTKRYPKNTGQPGKDSMAG